MGSNIYNIDKIKEFLRTAKLNTFIFKNVSVKEIAYGGKEYEYYNPPYKYCDRYYGDNIDAGQEIVMYENLVIWAMSYRGGMLKGVKFQEMCFMFLKHCLAEMPIDFPIRGPNEYEEGPLRYTNYWEGNIMHFVGEETIYRKDKKIYFRNYLGGVIKH